MILTLLASILPGVLLPAFKEWLAHKSNVETTRRDIALKTIDERMESRKHAKDIRLATAGFWEMRLLTFAIAMPFVSHLWAVWLDTQFGTFRDNCWQQAGKTVCGVPAFPEPFNEWQGAILLSFFGIYGGVKAIQYVGAAVAARRK
jgi:hypothetical protein